VVRGKAKSVLDFDEHRVARFTNGLWCRYEDTFDQVNNIVVIAQKTDKSKISDFGSPDKFLSDYSFLLGEQVWAGKYTAKTSFLVAIDASGSEN
jgi:PsbP